MEKIEKIASLYGQFVRVVVEENNDDINDERVTYFWGQFSSLYKEEFDSHPEELLSILRNEEEQLRRQLGRSYYRTFARKIETTQVARQILSMDHATENNLLEILDNETKFIKDTPVALAKNSLTKKLARPRHLLYFLVNSMQFIGNNLFFSTTNRDIAQLRQTIPSYSVLTWKDKNWLNLPVRHPTEKDIDEYFISAVQAKKVLEHNLEVEFGELTKTVHLSANEVSNLNSDIKELGGFFEDTTEWAKSFLKEVTGKGVGL